MIWICKECHGRIHGVQWNSDHGELTRAGLRKAKVRGRVGGNPALRARDPAMIQRIKAKVAENYLNDLLASADSWLPVVRRMRPMHSWQETAKVLRAECGITWSVERLRRSTKRLIAAGVVDIGLMKQAKPAHAPYTTGHLVPLVQALAPGRTMAQVAAQLEAMGERTPRGGHRWHASSVRNLLIRSI